MPPRLIFFNRRPRFQTPLTGKTGTETRRKDFNPPDSGGFLFLARDGAAGAGIYNFSSTSSNVQVNNLRRALEKGEKYTAQDLIYSGALSQDPDFLAVSSLLNAFLIGIIGGNRLIGTEVPPQAAAQSSRFSRLPSSRSQQSLTAQETTLPFILERFPVSSDLDGEDAGAINASLRYVLHSREEAGYGGDDDDDDDDDDDGGGFVVLHRPEDVLAHRDRLIALIEERTRLSNRVASLLLDDYRGEHQRLLSEWGQNSHRVLQRVRVRAESAQGGGGGGGGGGGEEARRDAGASCLVCHDDYANDFAPSPMGCDHIICWDCLRKHLSAQVSVNEVGHCVQQGCNEEWPRSVVRQALDAATFDRYLSILANRCVQLSVNLTWCPSPDCKKALYRKDVVASSSSKAVKLATRLVARCSCGHMVCWNCRETAHEPATCDQMEKWKERGSWSGIQQQRDREEIENARWITGNAKPCPHSSCGAPINKNEGCNHMTCRCGHQFCWLCLRDWRGHDSGSCPRVAGEVQKNLEAKRAALLEKARVLQLRKPYDPQLQKHVSFESNDDVWLAGRRRRAAEKGPVAAEATSRGFPHLLPQRVVLPSLRKRARWRRRPRRLRVALRVRARGCERRKGAIFSTDVFGTIVRRGRTRQTTAERRAMEGGAAARRDALSHGELQAVAAAVSTIVLRCQQERALGRLKEHLRARRRRTLTQDPHDGAEFVATSEAVVHLCYALGCRVIPRATPRWWVKRRTGGTWENLRLCDDATDDYFRDKLRMSPRVFREIAEACAPHLQRQVTLYREPLQPDQIVAYALYRWASGEMYESSTCNFGIGRASGLIAVHDVTATLLRVFGDKIAWPTGVRKQVVVDLDLRVLDVHMGYPGSCHNIRVLQLSSLSLRTKEGSLFRGPPVTLPFGVKTNGYLLADNGYPPAEWMVVPYGRINQSVDQERFDNKQNVARGAVERAFGRLKGMWRLFLQTHKTNLETLPQLFTAVCISHNLLIDAGIPFDKNLLWEVDGNGVRRRVDLGIDEPLQPVSMLTSTREALALRHALAERMKHE
ncbi:hypothetical protein CBR_g52697 [Chara braunii]|uniref:RBR-type E3 ubiquitin transferase n=1 Tax=Chara braunii TaxID=69332 RepID=A0A388MAQ3_CHABU|nr:hypothetical protein CBR_g52697 [Chara braunii]|eukprot:GBG91661.1 hypothetical protein CBR_g52697 [Chara braunii]